MKHNNIRHITSAPYHSATNGCAERSVLTFKNAMKKMKNSPICEAVDRFLFNYHITPHSVTGLFPAELLINRKLKSNLRILKPYHDTYHGCKKVRKFQFGEKLWIRSNITKTGPLSYKISYDGGEAKKHIDQLRKRSDEIEFHDIPLPNPESVTEETLITKNMPKQSPPTESIHNQSKDNRSIESPVVTPNTQNVINKTNAPSSTTPIMSPTPTLKPTPA